MNREVIEQLMDRWTNDAAFRDQVRADPQGALRATGLELDADEQAALENIDWNVSDEQLKARVNMAA